MNKIAQGTLDGFCGIYAAAHLIAILSGEEYDKASEIAFFQILSSLEKNKKLTAKRISSTNSDELGFSCDHIADALNIIPRRWAFGLSALSFRKNVFKQSQFFKNPKLAFEAGCGFIIQVDQGDHWVATNTFAKSGRYKCFDPSFDRDHKTFGKIFWDAGLMIGPTPLLQDL